MPDACECVSEAALMWERWKEKKQDDQAARWSDSVTVAMSATLEELKNRVGIDHHG